MNKLLPLALFFLALSCKTNKKVTDDSTTQCNTIATVKDFTGLDGCTFLLILDDGTKWRPNSIVDENFELKDGQKIKFGYKDAESMISACMAESKTIDITCIEVIASNESGGMPPKPERKPCVETTNPSEVAWMAELVKEHNPISITRYNYLDGFAYYLEGGPRSWLYDCQGTFLCDIPGKIMNDCVRKVNQLQGKLEIWRKK